MALPRKGILQELRETAEDLPDEQLREVIDFAGLLSQKRAAGHPAPGSSEALLRHAGSMSFEVGEMERLLEEIARDRELELDRYA